VASNGKPKTRIRAAGRENNADMNTTKTEATNEIKVTTMKYRTLLLTFLSAAAFTVGCEKTETTAEKITAVQEKTAAVAQEMKDYTFAQKAEFVKEMQGQLDALNKDLDQLAAKIEKSSDAIKAEAKPKLQALREQVAKLNKQLDEAKNATESTWDSVKDGFKKAYEASKDGFNQARQWVSDKIAP
jgi:chromosome segregation ATPase